MFTHPGFHFFDGCKARRANLKLVTKTSTNHSSSCRNPHLQLSVHSVRLHTRPDTFLLPSQQLLCNISLFSICVFLPEYLCLSPSDNDYPAWEPAASWPPAPPTRTFQAISAIYTPLSALRIARLNHAVHSGTDSSPDLVRGRHIQPVRVCGPCDPASL